MNMDTRKERLRREGIATSAREFLNRKVSVKWVLPPFIILGLLISVAFQRLQDLNERADRAAAVKTYEQCLESKTRSEDLHTVLDGILAIVAPIDTDQTTQIRQFLNEKLPTRDCDPVKPDGYPDVTEP